MEWQIPGQQRKNNVKQQLEAKVFKSSWDVVRRF